MVLTLCNENSLLFQYQSAILLSIIVGHPEPEKKILLAFLSNFGIHAQSVS